MGLCKCPKKNMTSLFCFEHRVNVCEHCLVESHSNCVVQTYLQWLSDSDFDPNCTLCSSPMTGTDVPTVRLQCLHVYHWGCLDEFARRLPPTTAPAGYRCPQCNEAIFPKPNQTSLLIEKLRSTLSEANWARAGLGMQMKAEFDRPIASPPPSTHQQIRSTPTYGLPQQTAVVGNYRASTPATVVNVDEGIEFGSAPSRSDQGMITRKKGYGEDRGGDTQPLMGNDADSEANKYKRRPPMEWARGLWKAKYGDGQTGGKPVTGCRKTVFIFFLLLLVFATLFMVLTRIIARPSAEDPMFDPMANPNIRVAAEESRGFH